MITISGLDCITQHYLWYFRFLIVVFNLKLSFFLSFRLRLRFLIKFTVPSVVTDPLRRSVWSVVRDPSLSKRFFQLKKPRGYSKEYMKTNLRRDDGELSVNPDQSWECFGGPQFTQTSFLFLDCIKRCVQSIFLLLFKRNSIVLIHICTVYKVKGPSQRGPRA